MTDLSDFDHGPFDAEDLVRWAEAYGDPEQWAKRAQALHAENERLKDDLRADNEEQVQKIEALREALERATQLAERYGDAIVAISEALPNVMRVRLIIAGLDSAAPDDGDR